MAADLESVPEEAARALLAVLFVRAEPLTLAELGRALEVDGGEVEAVAAVAEGLLEGTGLMLQRHRLELQLVSHPDQAAAVERALHPETAARLSRPALETLAIVAYRQPISRAAIEAIRGVDCDAVLGRLLQHDLVAVLGRSDGPGRALLYGTTMRFLQVAGIARLEDLPPLPPGGGRGWLAPAAESSDPDGH